eukprot:m.123411 g.123411  ORF g.123411 m.123411 type:complete len:421 (+) comp12948_c0_seq5:174-1436(+)
MMMEETQLQFASVVLGPKDNGIIVAECTPSTSSNKSKSVMRSNEECLVCPHQDNVLSPKKKQNIIDNKSSSIQTQTPSETNGTNKQKKRKIFEAIPFSDQVGGHSPCARLKEDPSIVCKPAGSREVLFYETFLPDELKEFLPAFHGVKLVRLSTPYGGETVTNDKKSPLASLTSTPPPLLVKSATMNEEDGSDTSSDENDDEYAWYTHCFKRHLSKGNMNVMECLLLENLTDEMTKPCIMDLKMGTRTFKDNATEKKRIRALEKAAETTTAGMGLRVCGIKLYNKVTGKYSFEDKYIGRKLTQNTIKDTFQQFLGLNGDVDLRERVVSILCERIHRLRFVIASLPLHRFYSTSLLLIFDACPKDPKTAVADLRMIDFANSQCYVRGGDEIPSDVDLSHPDEGYLLGLDNLELLLKQTIQP